MSSPTNTSNERCRVRLIMSAAFLIALVFAVYGTTLTAGWNLARQGGVLHVPLLSHIGNAPDIVGQDFLPYSDGQFRPVPYLLLATLRTFVSSENVVLWRLLLLSLHALSALLVFCITHRLSRRLDVGWLAGCVFALHPVCTTVVNDVERIHLLLGTAFTLASVYCYLRFALDKSGLSYLGSILLFALALLTSKSALLLGLFIFAYEALYRREGVLRSLLRALPFCLIPILFVPLWTNLRAHPVYYVYLSVTPSSIFFSFLSAIAATGHYINALLLTREIPSILHEIAPQIYSPSHPAFWGWAVVDLLLLAGVIWGVVKKRLAALGVALSLVAMLPFLSVAFNQTINYISFSYLGLPVAGYAIFLVATFGFLFQSKRPVWKWTGRCAAIALLIFLAGRTVELNFDSRTPVDYWESVLRLNPNSRTAQCELGKALLVEGQTGEALQNFFNPYVNGLQDSCLAMTRYYLSEGDLLAAAVHLRLAQLKNVQTGSLYLAESEVAGELFLQADALDYAEHHFGRIMMVDPFHTRAMIRLAQIWHCKGRVAAAGRILERAEEIDPSDLLIADVKNECQEREREWLGSSESPIVNAPKPDWLRYILHEEFTPSLLDDIVALSERVDPNDAAVQLEATVALLESGRYAEASKKAKAVIDRLSGNSFACSIVCRALALAGEIDLAVKAGSRAVSLDVQNVQAWESLALAYALQDKPNEVSQKFMDVVARRPSVAAVFYFNLGVQKKENGLYEESIGLFEKTLAASPHNPDAYRELGYVYWNLKRVDDAIASFQKAVAADPNSAQAHGALGGALLGRDRIGDAIEELQTAIRIDPENANYQSNLGVAFAKSDRDEEAVSAYRRALELDGPLGSIYFNLANSLLKLKRNGEAESAYRQALERVPDHPYAHYNLARILTERKEYAEAIGEYEKQYECNPSLAQIYPALIVLYFNQRDMEKARLWLDRVKERNIPIDPRLQKAIQN